jgi:hypothetical protein
MDDLDKLIKAENLTMLSLLQAGLKRTFTKFLLNNFSLFSMLIDCYTFLCCAQQHRISGTFFVFFDSVQQMLAEIRDAFS